jgi:hypothetical protein
MKKKNVWVASDGKEFTDQVACIVHERTEGFRKAVIQFVQKHLQVSEDQAIELVVQLDDMWSIIRDNSEDFQEVLNLAKPKKRMGRPPTKQKTAPTNTVEVVDREKALQLLTPAYSPDITLRGEMARIPRHEQPAQAEPTPPPGLGETLFGSQDSQVTPTPPVETPPWEEDDSAGLPPVVPKDLSQAVEVEGAPTPYTPPAPWRAPR